MNISTMEPLVIKSPAKINLTLSVLGARDDGFHELLSWFAPLEMQDEIRFFSDTQLTEDQLIIPDNRYNIPTDEGNLVLKAAHLFREAYPHDEYFKLELIKNIPAEAGLGGGSGNAVSTLLGLNKYLGNPIDEVSLAELAAQLGSDCPFFILNQQRVCCVEGRGEVVTPLKDDFYKVLKGATVLLFKPDFSVNTGWAFGKLKENQAYMSRKLAEDRLEHVKEELLKEGITDDLPLYNDFERILFPHYVVYSVFQTELMSRGLPPIHITGSGSTAFWLLPEDYERKQDLISELERCFGEATFRVETKIR